MSVNLDAVRAVWSTTRIGPLWCSGALSIVVLLIPILLGARLNFLDATLLLHLAMVMLLIGAAFVMDDPARPLVAVLPFSGVRADLVRMLLSLVVVSTFWLILLWLAPYTVVTQAAYPRAGLAIEAFALLAWMWAGAMAAGKLRGSDSRGSVAAPLLLLFSVGLAVLPESAVFYISPSSPGYDESRTRWVYLFLTGIVALALVTPERRRIRMSKPSGEQTGR